MLLIANSSSFRFLAMRAVACTLHARLALNRCNCIVGTYDTGSTRQCLVGLFSLLPDAVDSHNRGRNQL